MAIGCIAQSGQAESKSCRMWYAHMHVYGPKLGVSGTVGEIDENVMYMI